MGYNIPKWDIYWKFKNKKFFAKYNGKKKWLICIRIDKIEKALGKQLFL